MSCQTKVKVKLKGQRLTLYFLSREYLSAGVRELSLGGGRTLLALKILKCFRWNFWKREKKKQLNNAKYLWMAQSNILIYMGTLNIDVSKDSQL